MVKLRAAAEKLLPPRRWGVTHTLDEVVECPQVVKHMLNDECGLGQAYLGTRCPLCPLCPLCTLCTLAL